MTVFLLSIYFFCLYIRPQDWVTFMLNWPMDWIVYGILLMFVPLKLHRLPTLFSLHVFRLLLLWIVVIALSNLVHLDRFQAQERVGYYLPFVVVFASLMLFMETGGQLRAITWFQILLATILAIQCIDMVHTGRGWAGQTLGWDDGYGGRARWVGLWDGMGVLSLLFVVAFPFLMQFLLGPWSAIHKIVSLVSMALLSTGIVLTQARGGFVALALSVFIGLLIQYRVRKAILPLGLAAACLIVLAPARAGTLDDREGSKSSYYRIEMWSAGLSMLKDNPLLGVGKGRFAHFSNQMTGKHLIAHNTYIENAGETGMVGLWVYVALVYVTIKGLREVRKKVTEPRDQSMAKAMIVSVYGYVASSMFVTTDFDLFYVQLGTAAAFCCMHGCYPTLTRKDCALIFATAVAFLVCVQAYVIVAMR